VWDEDVGSADEQAGSLIFNVKELIKECNDKQSGKGQCDNKNIFRWVNIYGAPGQEGIVRKGD